MSIQLLTRLICIHGENLCEIVRGPHCEIDSGNHCGIVRGLHYEIDSGTHCEIVHSPHYKAVSYTHLDVYKRQIQRSCTEQMYIKHGRVYLISGHGLCSVAPSKGMPVRDFPWPML